MSKLKMYFRYRQRQNTDPQDYFSMIMEKYGSDISYSQVDTIYLAVDRSDLRELRKDHFMIAETATGPAIVIKEMVGEINVDSEKDALDICNNFSDHVFAEYIHPIYCDRGPV